MKSSIPTPVFIGVIVIVLLGIGVLIWSKANRATSNAEVANIASTINQSKPATAPLSQQEAAGDMMMMGGGPVKK